MKKQILNISMVMLLIGVSIIAKAQTESIITPMTTSCNLTESQLTMVSKANDTNYFKEHFFVNVQNLYNSHQDGKVLFDLPQIWENPIVLSNNYVEYTDESNYVYSGVFTDGIEEGETSLYYARLLLIGDNGKKFGQLKINDLVYTIYDLNGSCQMIANMKKPDIEGGGCPGITAPPETELDLNYWDNLDIQPSQCGDCIAAVYFFATPEADAADPDYTQTARTSVEIVNASIANSAIQGVGSQLRLRISGSQILTGFTQLNPNTTTINDAAREDLERFSFNNFQFNGTSVRTIREQTQSDVATLLTAPTYGGTLGVTWWGPYPQLWNGFVMANWNSAATGHTFAHEVGHIIGCGHQVSAPNPSDLDAYAHAFRLDIQGSSTVGLVTHEINTNVATFRGGGVTVTNLDFYSNPRIVINDLNNGIVTPIGTSTSENNSMQIGIHGCELAHLFPNPQQVSSYLTGPSIVCPNQWADFNLQLNCPGEVLSLTWEYSYNGFHWNTFSTTTGSGGLHHQVLIPQFVIDEVLFVRARFNIGGQTYTPTMKCIIDITSSPCNVQYKIEPETITLDNTKLYPNPTTGLLKIDIETLENEKYDKAAIVVYDFYGRKIYDQVIAMPNPGITQHQLSFESYRKGIYFVMIKGKRYVVEKL